MRNFYSYWEADHYKNRGEPADIKGVVLYLTTFCNLKCPECEVNVAGIAHPEHYSIDYITNAASCLFGIEHLAISGGEPTSHPQFREIVPRLREWFGCRSISLTTNGYKILEYQNLLHHFDDILLSHYDHNQEEAKFLAQRGLDSRPPGSTIHVTTARRARQPGPCNRANFVSYVYGRLYPCGSVPNGHEEIGIPLTKNWASEILNVPCPCAGCCFAEETCCSPRGEVAVTSAPVSVNATKAEDEIRPASRWPAPRPDIAVYGLEVDSWMGREAEIKINPNLGATRLLIDFESHAPKPMHPIKLTITNEFFKKPYVYLVTEPGQYAAQIALHHIPKSITHTIIKMQCDTTFIPHQVEPSSPDTRELGMRIVSVRYHLGHSCPEDLKPQQTQFGVKMAGAPLFQKNKNVVKAHEFDIRACRSILIPRFDMFGDIILLQGFLEALCDLLPDARIVLLVREGYDQLKCMFPNQLSWLTTQLDPYRNSPDAEIISSFLRELGTDAYDLLLTTTYNRTWADDLIAHTVSFAWRVGLGGSNTSKISDELCKVLTTLGMESPRFPYDQITPVAETIHETEKYQILWETLIEKEAPLPTARLSISPDLELEAQTVIDDLGLTTDRFVVCCPAGIANVSNKKWPEEYFAQVILHLEKHYNLRSLIVGHEAEEPITSKLRDLAIKQGAHSLVWLAKSGTFPTSCALVKKSRLYLGNDTGMMHAAAALNKPVITIFGGGWWPRFLPSVTRGRVFVLPLPCFYCHWDCPFDRAICLTCLKPAFVIQETEVFIDTLLQGDGDFKIVETYPLNSFSEEYGSDLIDIIINKVREYRNVIQEKEDVIQAQQKALHTNQSELVSKDMLIASQHQELMVKEDMIRTQDQELVAKEGVIQSLLIFRRSSLRCWDVHYLRPFLKQVLPGFFQNETNRIRRWFQR